MEQKDQSQIGVSQVLATIQQGTSEWPRDRLRVRKSLCSQRNRYHKKLSILTEIPRIKIQICGRGTTRRVFYTLRMECRLSRSIITLGCREHKIIFSQQWRGDNHCLLILR